MEKTAQGNRGITSVVKDRKVSGDEKSRTRDGDDAAIFGSVTV